MEASSSVRAAGSKTRFQAKPVSTEKMETHATDAAQLQHDLRWVPIPAGAVPSNGTDKHMVIWRPSTDTMWDLWRVENYGTPASPNWHAYWGAKITSVCPR